MIPRLIRRRRIVLLFGGPKDGTEVRTSAATITEPNGSYIITSKRDRLGRRIFRWEVGGGGGGK